MTMQDMSSRKAEDGAPNLSLYARLWMGYDSLEGPAAINSCGTRVPRLSFVLDREKGTPVP